MTARPSHSILACLLLLAACPGNPEPQPAEESSTGPGDPTSTGPGPGTTPEPLDTGSSGADTTAAGTSTGPDDTTGSSGTSSGSDDPSTSGSSSGDPSTSGSSSGDPSTSGSSSGDPSTTTSGDPCDAGDGPVFTVTNAGAADYVINGLNDPPLTVVRGCSYTFDVNAPGHPFLVKTVQGTGVANAYGDGVVGNGAATGTITWDVSLAAPDQLFYNCQLHAPMTGTITVIDP